MFAALALLVVGCDVGPRDEQPAHGPALHVLATYPVDGQGTNGSTDAGVDCATPTPDCAVPTNFRIELRFDRFLLPVSALEAGITLFTGDEANAVGLQASYRLIERVVVIQPTGRIFPNTLYTLEITPSTNPNQGFWAFDRAPLEAGPVPLRFSFTTGNGAVAIQSDPVTSDNCQTLTLPLRSAGQVELPAGPLNVCGACHKTPPAVPPTDPTEWQLAFPPMGLTISDWGLKNTAIDFVAHETATGDSAFGPGLDSAPRFGVQMNIIEPGSPENSYLMYKLLRRPESYGQHKGCSVVSLHAPVSDDTCTAPSDDELTRLREWFVRGEPMPIDIAGPSPLSRDELDRVSNWISSGASCVLP